MQGLFRAHIRLCCLSLRFAQQTRHACRMLAHREGMQVAADTRIVGFSEPAQHARFANKCMSASHVRSLLFTVAVAGGLLFR